MYNLESKNNPGHKEYIKILRNMTSEERLKKHLNWVKWAKKLKVNSHWEKIIKEAQTI